MFIYLFTWLHPGPWDLLAAACRIFLVVACKSLGLPWCLSGKESVCHIRRCRFRKIPWRRTWQLTSVFLPREAHGRRSQVGYNPWGPKKVGHNWELNNNSIPQGQAQQPPPQWSLFWTKCPDIIWSFFDPLEKQHLNSVCLSYLLYKVVHPLNVGITHNSFWYIQKTCTVPCK